MNSVSSRSRFTTRYNDYFVYLCMCLFFLVATFFAGCTRTETGGYADSPDEKYRVYITTVGAYGRSFVDYTSKMLRVAIVANVESDKLLFSRDYHIKGSDLVADAAWKNGTNVTVVLYDYGRGIPSSEGKEKGYRTNHVLTVTYRFEQVTGTFQEQPSK